MSEVKTLSERGQGHISGDLAAAPPRSEDPLIGYCKHRRLFVSGVSCVRCFRWNQSPRDETAAGLTCAHRKHPTHTECVSEQIASPQRDGVEITRCFTVSFKDRSEVGVFVRYRIVSRDGRPGYEIEEVVDDATGEPITLTPDELGEIEEHLIKRRGS